MSSTRRPNNGRKKILVIGTHPAVLVSLRTMLTLRQFEVLVADRPAAAIQLAGKNPSINLALIDVCAIPADPQALAANLRAIRPDLRMLFFSSLVDGEVIRLGVIDPGRNVLRREGVMAAIEEALGLTAAPEKAMTAGGALYAD